MRAHLLLVPAAAAALLTAGCAASSGGGGSTPQAGVSGPTSSGASSSSAPACSPSTLKTRKAGTFTVATDSPAYEPWFVDDKPANGKGYESAVAFAVAKQLGYPAGKVHWVTEAFNSAIAPTPKNFDVDVNEVSISASRAKAVDFSTGYYDVAQAVVVLDSSKYSKVTTIAGLKGAKLGAQKGSTSLDALNDVIKPGTAAGEYPTNPIAVQTLSNGQIDGLVVDLPTALEITGSGEIKHAKVLGQLPVTGNPEQFGMVLDHDSPITSCVSKAVDALRSNGTLATLQKQWLTTSAGAPELK